MLLTYPKHNLGSGLEKLGKFSRLVKWSGMLLIIALKPTEVDSFLPTVVDAFISAVLRKGSEVLFEG